MVSGFGALPESIGEGMQEDIAQGASPVLARCEAIG